MSQMHTKQPESTASKRRKYLWRISVAKTGLGLAFLAFACVVTASGMVFSVFARPDRYEHDRFYQVVTSLGFRTEALLAIGVGIPTLVVLTYILHRQARYVASIEPVPAVSKQIAALPAAETLVRGSDQRSAGSTHLLRPAREDAEPAAGELLRPGPSAPTRPT